MGTVSDENGYYLLDIPSHFIQENLRFSMVGFSKYEVLISSLEGKFNFIHDVNLSTETTALNEVIVTSGTWKTMSEGNKTESKLIVAGFTSNQLGNEIAQFIRVKKNRPTRVQAFWLAVAENNIESVILRLNIYTEKEGFPDENLLKKPIYIHLPNEPQTIKVDLKPFDIYLEDSFFISLEWIEDLGVENLWFSASLFGKQLYARNASQGEWVRQKALGIGMGVELFQKHN